MSLAIEACPVWHSWEEKYDFQWAALEATINYYSTMLEDWDD